jgi:hypothetical protein
MVSGRCPVANPATQRGRLISQLKCRLKKSRGAGERHPQARRTRYADVL